MKKKLSEMTDKELRDYILETRGEMRTLLDTAEKEERDLTADEQSKFDELKRSAEVAEARQIANLRPLPVKEEEEKKEIRKSYDIFGENLRSDVDSGAKKVRIEVRTDPENVNIDSTDVADTIPVLFKDIVHALAPNTIIEKVGSKMLFGVQGQPTWPTVGDVAAQWAGENEALLDATIDFDAIKATPNRLGVKVKVSRRALNQSNLDLYNIVVSKIGRAFAAKLNQAMVSLTQVAINAPKGVFVTPALNPIVLSEKPTFEEVVSLETAVLNENVGGATQGFGAYIIGTAMQGKLKTTPIDLNGDNMILKNGEMNGYPVIVSNYMDEGSIGFGFFEYSVVSQFGDMNLIFDPYTQASNNEVVFVANSEFDITVLRPEAFALGQIPETT
jgi:HK97 family phage major capsid protein